MEATKITCLISNWAAESDFIFHISHTIDTLPSISTFISFLSVHERVYIIQIQQQKIMVDNHYHHYLSR